MKEIKKPFFEWIDRKNPVYLSFFSPIINADYKWNTGECELALEQSRLVFYRAAYLRDGGVSRSIQHWWISKGKQALDRNNPDKAKEPLSLLIQSGDFFQWAPILSKWISKKYPDKIESLRFPLLKNGKSFYFNVPMKLYTLPLEKPEEKSQKAILEMTYLQYINSEDIPKEGNLFILPVRLFSSKETPASIIVELSERDNLNGAFIAVNAVVPKWNDKGIPSENMLILENVFRKEWKFEGGITLDRIFIYLPPGFHGKILKIDLVPYAGILY